MHLLPSACCSGAIASPARAPASPATQCPVNLHQRSAPAPGQPPLLPSSLLPAHALPLNCLPCRRLCPVLERGAVQELRHLRVELLHLHQAAVHQDVRREGAVQGRARAGLTWRRGAIRWAGVEAVRHPHHHCLPPVPHAVQCTSSHHCSARPAITASSPSPASDSPEGRHIPKH